MQTKTGLKKKKHLELSLAELDWNVYSAKLNRMNSIENTLHSSTGHLQRNTCGGSEGVAGADVED